MPHGLHGVRPAAVAGAFYPGDAGELANEVDALRANAVDHHVRPKALIVPHAGYIYSGSIAASAYAAVASMRPLPTKVVLLGPSHHVGFKGLALPGVEALATPQGLVEVDAQLVERIRHFAFVGSSGASRWPSPTTTRRASRSTRSTWPRRAARRASRRWR